MTPSYGLTSPHRSSGELLTVWRAAESSQAQHRPLSSGCRDRSVGASRMELSLFVQQIRTSSELLACRRLIYPNLSSSPLHHGPRRLKDTQRAKSVNLRAGTSHPHALHDVAQVLPIVRPRSRSVVPKRMVNMSDSHPQSSSPSRSRQARTSSPVDRLESSSPARPPGNRSPSQHVFG